MSEPTLDAPADTATGSVAPPIEEGTDWKSEARKWEARAKENRQALQALEKQQQASMTDAERAVADAKAAARSEAVHEFGQRLVRSEFVGAAARRNPAWDAAAVVDDLNLGRYVGEDGEPDVKAIAKAVERLVPAAAQPGTTNPGMDLGGGQPVRTGQDFNQLLRAAAGRA